MLKYLEKCIEMETEVSCNSKEDYKFYCLTSIALRSQSHCDRVSRECTPRLDVPFVRANRRLSFENHSRISLHKQWRYASRYCNVHIFQHLGIVSLSILFHIILLHLEHLYFTIPKISENQNITRISYF